MRYTYAGSPVGELLLAGDDDGLAALFLPESYRSAPRRADRVQPGWVRADDAFDDVRAQLGEYFAGTRTEFDLRLNLRGSAFQRRVWAALLEIPHGTTTSYGAIAADLGMPGAARAVGLANGQNPVSIIVPCHRVVGANGSLTGYGGGLPAKRFLLSLEAAGAGLFAL